MPIEAFIRIKLFTCRSAMLGWSSLDLEIGGKFLPGFHGGRRGRGFAGHGSMLDHKSPHLQLQVDI